MLKNEIIKLLDGLSTKNKDSIKPLLLPSIGFKVNSVLPKPNFSKIGGYPPIFEKNYPLLNEKPLLFLGQISLDQISNINNILPKKGILCFFLSVDDIGYRYPDRKGGFKVIHVEDVKQTFLAKNLI